ncbi:MAG: hypothetical protein L3K03_00890 [Thermoplasmata archaeon]|nr:hypothetical protein [Thermoplasmata archaeon]
MEPGDELVRPTEGGRPRPSDRPSRDKISSVGLPPRVDPDDLPVPRTEDPAFWLAVLIGAATVFAVGVYMPFRYGYPWEYLAFPFTIAGGAVGSIAISRWQLLRRSRAQEGREERLAQLPSFEVYTPPKPPSS